MDFSNDKLIELPRPELGRPTDPRLTEEYIAARPELERAGYPAFDPGRDIDYHGYIEGALQWLHAQVRYADPALHEDLVTLRDEAQKTLADTAQQQLSNNQQTADALAVLGGIPTQLSGLRVTTTDDGYLFEADAAATTPATVQAAPLGGLLYEVNL